MSTWNSVTTVATGYAGGQPVELVSSSTTGLYLTAITSTSSSTGIIYSSDSGTTWAPSTGTPTTGLINAVVSDSTGQYVIFTHAADSLSTNTGGVYRSVDYGVSFSQISILGSYAFDFVSCSADGQVIYANQPLSNQLMLSTNGGSNWVVATTAMSGNLNGCCSADGSYYYYGFGNSLIAGTGTGTTWSTVTIPTSIGQVACDATGLILVITCNGSGVYRSTNGGSTWTLTNAPTDAGQAYQPIACDPNGNIIVTGDVVNQTAYFSFDSGSTWNVIGSPFRSLLVTGDGQTMFSSNGYELYSTATSVAPVTPIITSVIATDSSSVTIVFTLGSNGNSLLTDIQYATDHDSYASWTSLGLSTPLEGYTSASITGLSFNPIGANFQLRAVNAIGPSTASSPVLVNVVADAPTITSIIAIDSSSVTIGFTLGSNQGSDLTDIQYATSNDSYASWTSLGLTAPLEGYTTATISGLAFDPISVYFELRAVNVAGNSGVSEPKMLSVIPDAPTITAVTPIDSASVYIAFTLGSNGDAPLTDIQYAISTDSYATWTTVGLSTPLEGYTNVTISGLAFDPTGVIFKLRAVNAVGPSNASNIVSVPDAPTITTRPLQVDTQQFTIGFTLGSNGGSDLTDIRYVVLDDSLNNITGDTYSIGLTPPLEGYTTATIIIPDGINAYNIVNFQLFSVNANGSSAYSAASHIATAPDYPTLVSAYVTNPTTAVLTFTLGSNGGRPLTDLQYAIYDNNYTLVHAFTSLGLTAPFEGYTTATITDLSSIPYGLLFNITAITAIGQGDSINNIFTPLTIVFPDAPTITSVTAIDTSSATIVFTLGSNQGSDLTDIQYATSNDSYASWTSLGLSTPLEGYTTATISGLAFDPLGVYFELRAINIAGNSPASTDVICVSSAPPSAWTVMYPYNFGCISSSTDGSSIAAVQRNSNRFYHSLDSGLSFQPAATLDFPLSSTNSIGMSSDGVTVIVNRYDGIIYVSTDHGNTFAPTGGEFSVQLSNIVCSSDAQYVYALNVDTHSNIWYSNDGGANWTLSSDFPYISWVSLTCDSTGKNVYASGTDEFGNQVTFSSNTYGALWNINRDVIGGQPPSIYYPFEGSVVDVRGGSPDITGNPGFVSGVVGTYALNLQNTFGSPATQYIRQGISLATTANFGVSFWFNSQGVATGQTVIFELGTSGDEAFTLCTSTNNQLYVQYQMTGAAWGSKQIAASTDQNTWYHICIIFNYNETCDIYLNNKLAVSFPANIEFYVAPTILSIGCYAVHTGGAYPGYIDDFRFYGSRITPNVAIPSIYYPFENSITDVMGGDSTVVGTPGFIGGVVGNYALNLTNTSPGGYAEQCIRHVLDMTTSPSFTISFRFNAQTLPGEYQSFLFEAGTTGDEVFCVTLSTIGELIFQYQKSSGWSYTTLTSSISLNTWYYVRINYAYNGNCYVFLDGTQTDTFPVNFTLYTAPNLLSIGAAVMDARGAFTGYLDDFHMYNTAVSIYPSSAPMITSMACDSTGQYIVASAANYNGVYRSSDYGQTFSNMTSPGSYYFNRIACDSTATKILVSEISNNHVFYSEDTGATWTQQSISGTNQPLCVAMTSDATYLYTSQDYDRSYINAFPSSIVPWSRVDPLYYYVHYSADNQYLVGVNDNNGQVIRSIDGGATWNEATTYPDTYPNRLAMDYSGQYVVGAWGGIGLFRSTDYADNFTQLTAAPSYNYECIATSYTGQYIYSGVWDGVIVLSSDAGTTFTEVDAAGGNRYWNAINCSASGQYVYALCQNQGWSTELYYSSNYGQTWLMTSLFSDYAIQDIACDGTGQYVLATCGNDGVYRSTDYGATWARTAAFYESPNGPDYRDIICNASGEQILVLDDNIGLVYRSTDSGATWAAQYMPGYYNWDGGSLAMSLDGSKQLTELYNVGTFTTTSRTDNIPTPSNPVPCFLEGTKILCLVNGKEEYVPVETLRKGSIVKTSLNGYKTVKLIGHRAMTNAGGINRDKNSLYLCTKAAYPELTEDLTITGCHAILVDQLTTVQRAGIINTLERIFVTDRKYRLPACIDERAAVVQTAGEFTVWHFALEHHDIKMNYGVYAQGLLVESSPIWHMSLKNYTLV